MKESTEQIAVKDPRSYYDDFSRSYDDARESGYHAYIDDFEAESVRRWLHGSRVLEVGCGTGQILKRVRAFAPKAVGIDLSAGMLQRSRARGYDVSQASATELPFKDRSFDLVYSFKVLPHVPELGKALAEVARVLDVGGIALLEFYNPNSLRGLWKRVRWWKVSVGRQSHDRQVYTSYHTPGECRGQLPAGLRHVAGYGAVVLTPHPKLHRVPLIAAVLRGAENLVGRTPLARWGGFYILVARKEDGPR